VVLLETASEWETQMQEKKVMGTMIHHIPYLFAVMTFFFKIYLFERKRERASRQMSTSVRGRGRENPK